MRNERLARWMCRHFGHKRTYFMGVLGGYETFICRRCGDYYYLVPE